MFASKRLTHGKLWRGSPAFLLFFVLAQGAASAAPTVKTFTFDVIRNNDSKIGTHVTTITTDKKKTVVDMNTDIDVHVMFFDAYSFKDKLEEVWNGGKFQSFVCDTNDNGTKHHVVVQRSGKKLTVTADGKTVVAPPDAIPATFWNEALARSGPVILPKNGAIVQITVKKVEDAKEALPPDVTHYQVSGGISRDLWFRDKDPYQYRLIGRDGSVIESRLNENAAPATPQKAPQQKASPQQKPSQQKAAKQKATPQKAHKQDQE